MYAEDNLQDVLSSIGPYRLERVVRRGLCTVSCKVLEMPAGRPLLLKIHKKPPAGGAKLIAKKDSFYVEQRDWWSRCLKDRLFQFPYPSKAECGLILKCIQHHAARVKASNVLMTHWNRVVFVDGQDRPGDRVACYLDDTDDPLDLAQFQQALGMEALLDDFSFALVQRLALFQDHQDCFERAAYITVHQIREAKPDIADLHDLLEILANCTVQIVYASTIASTRILALELMADLLALHLPKQFVALAVVPCLLDCLARQHSQVESILCITILSSIHERVDAFRKTDTICNLIADNPQVLAVYGSRFSDPSAFEWLVEEGQFALAALVADQLDRPTVSAVCIPKLAACDDPQAMALLVDLACRVYDPSQIEQWIVPLVGQTDVHLWVPLVLSNKLDQSVVRALIQDTKSADLKAACRSVWKESDYLAHIAGMDAEATTSVPRSSDPPPSHPQAIMEVDEDRGSGGCAPALGKFDIFSSTPHSALRFWQPSASHSLPPNRTLQVLQSSRHSVHFFDTRADIFSTADYPRSAQLLESLAFQDAFLLACVHPNGFVGVTTQCPQGVATLRLYDLQGGAKCIATVALSGCPVHVSLLDHSLVCVYQQHAETVHLSTKQRHVVQLAHPATSAAVSLFGAFAVVGTATGHLLLLDLRCMCVSARHLVTATPIHSVQVTSEWSERAEHKRGRAWIGTGEGLFLVDLRSGHIVKDRSLSRSVHVEHVLTSAGAHYVVGITKDTLLHYDWRTRKVLEVQVVEGVDGVDSINTSTDRVLSATLLPFSKCVAVVREGGGVQFVL